MLTIEFPELSVTKYLPENLDECNQSEYIMVGRLAYALSLKEISLQQFKTLMIFGLLGIKKSKKELPKETQSDVWGNISRLTEYIDNYFDYSDDGSQLRLNTDYLSNKIEYFKLFFRKYNGPTDPLEHITFGQWIDGVELILNQKTDNSEDIFTKLLAIFYLKKNEKYPTENTVNFIEKRAKNFKYIDKGIQYGFFIYFTSFMNYLNSIEVEIGGNVIDLSIIFDNTEDFTSQLASIGIRATAHSLAQSGEFGDYNNVRETKLGEVLLRLYESKKTYLDEKAKSEKQK